VSLCKNAAGFGSGLGLSAPQAVPQDVAAVVMFLLFQEARFESAIVSPHKDKI